jgi:SAM-dependent methyltransferase
MKESSLVIPVSASLQKKGFSFIAADDRRFSYRGRWEQGADGVMIGKEPKALCRWFGPMQGAVLVLVCHPFSGIIRMTANRSHHLADNYSWFSFWKAFPIRAEVGPLTISIAGKNPHARGAELVVAGIFLPDAQANNVETRDSYDFEKLQAQMVDNWMENIRKDGRDVMAVTRNRQTTYLQRWKEVLPYAQPGARVLDIGAGFLYAELFYFLRQQDFDYTAIDIDRRAILANQNAAEGFGFSPNSFVQGLNTKLAVSSESVDLVFSSHCLEHSEDLCQTFQEIRRVLRSNGYLFFAVPASVDVSQEHIYFLCADDWAKFVEDAGFSIVNQHIGSMYPETGYDIAIVARKTSAGHKASE